MDGYYSDDEIKLLGFKFIGKNNKISNKSCFYNTKNIYIGNNCRIDDNCIISASSKGIYIGNFVHLSNNVTLSGNAFIKLDDYSGLSSKVSVFGSTDDYSGKFMTNPCVGSFNSNLINVKSEDIIIGKHVIIGCNSVILPGCSIADGVSIGALSLVNRKIFKEGIYQGNPINFIQKKDNNYKLLEEKYFNNDLNNDNSENDNSENDNLFNKNLGLPNINIDIYSILSEYINGLNNLKDYNILISSLGVDSLSFLQIQSIIYKKYNILIDNDISLINILKIGNDLVNNIEIDSNINKNMDEELIKKKSNNSLINDISITSNFSNDINNIKIIGIGHALPSKKVENSFYEKFLDTTDEWIKVRTGISQKYILDENETMEELIIKASLQALNEINLNPKELDLIILASSTPEDLFGDASKIAFKIGAENAFGFDIRNACNGFLTSVVTGENFLLNNKNRFNTALIIGADCLSRHVNWSDRKSCILFGDGVGCVILKKTVSNNNSGILSSFLKTSGEKNTILNINSKSLNILKNNVNLINNNYDNLTIDGINVYKFVIDNLPNYIINFLKTEKKEISEIKYFVLHQANYRIIEEISKKLNIPKNKFLYNINNVGNTSAASIPILLSETYQNNKLNKNDLLLLCSFGAGMSSSLMLLNWTMENKLNDNKIALITGGTKGIGRSIAINLKNKGYKTIICSRNKCNNIPENIDHYICDISKLENIKELYNKIFNKYRRLDILVNNAGIEGNEKLFIDSTTEDIEDIININLVGTLNITKIMIDLLKKSNGKIINISSIACANSISNCFRRTLYSLTKSSLGVFTRGLAGELKDICDVYSINPPFVDTDLLERISNNNKINKDLMNYNGIVTNIKKIVNPNEISNIVYLLIEGKTRYSSGDEILILDGNKTSYMKYLYEHISEKTNKKIEITDIESYSINNLYFFQGQGLKLSLNMEEIKKHIELNNYDELLEKTINLNFQTLFLNYINEPQNTFYQQLLIYICSYILFNIENENNLDFFNDIKYFVGYSLGEITALTCSQNITFEDGLKIVYTRASSMHLISNKINTSMIYVKGLSIEEIKLYLSTKIFVCINLSKNSYIIGGDKEELAIFKEKIKNQKNIIKDLLVEGSYHTEYYKDVEKELDITLNNINFIKNNKIVYSNYKSNIYNELNYKLLIKNQVFNQVDWSNIMDILKNENISNIKEINVANSYLLNIYENS